MNLYRINFAHYAPKDREDGIKCLLLAENDEAVYNYVRKLAYWEDYEEVTYVAEEEEFLDGDDEIIEGWYDKQGNPEDFKTRMIRLRGQINDDEHEVSDLYYGTIIYGWELVVENTKVDYSELIAAGIVVKQ